MNILIGSNVHWWNAEAAYAALVAELLQQSGHRVFVLTRPGTENEAQLRKRGLPLITDINLNSYHPWRLYHAYQHLKRFVQQQHIDIVNPHRSEGFFIYVLLARSLKSCKIIRTRGTTRPVRNSWFNRYLYLRWTEAHIMAGQVVRDQFLQSIALPPAKTTVIYYPVDLPSLPLPVSANYYEEFHIPLNCQKLAIVGRTSPVKGHRLLLQSLRELLFYRTDVVLLILYKHPDPQRPQLLALQEEVKHLELDAHVRFIGPREDIRNIMEFADVGVISSIDSEVICRVAVEFFSVGTPVVAFPTGCLPELIYDGVNGYVAESCSSSALTDTLIRILQDPQRLQQLRLGARQQAEQRFSYHRFLDSTLHVFQQCLSNEG